MEEEDSQLKRNNFYTSCFSFCRQLFHSRYLEQGGIDCSGTVPHTHAHTHACTHNTRTHLHDLNNCHGNLTTEPLLAALFVRVSSHFNVFSIAYVCLGDVRKHEYYYSLITKASSPIITLPCPGLCIAFVGAHTWISLPSLWKSWWFICVVAVTISPVGLSNDVVHSQSQVFGFLTLTVFCVGPFAGH